MTRQEYEDYAHRNEDWAPGWDAMERCFASLYPGQEPSHFGTDITKRAIFGGDQYLDGYSLYQSAHGYKHIVTYGMSSLYANVDSYGGEYSGWGYEMTIKLPVSSNEECLWALDMLSNLANYTYTQKRFFEPLQYISGNGKPIKMDSGSRLTGLLVITDPELSGADTVHGRLDFLQLVGITQPEVDALTEDPNKAQTLISRMKMDNPHFITNLVRTHNYV